MHHLQRPGQWPGLDLGPARDQFQINVSNVIFPPWHFHDTWPHADCRYAACPGLAGPSCTYLILADSDRAVNEISRKFSKYLERSLLQLWGSLSQFELPPNIVKTFAKIRWQLYVDSEQHCLNILRWISLILLQDLVNALFMFTWRSQAGAATGAAAGDPYVSTAATAAAGEP